MTRHLPRLGLVVSLALVAPAHGKDGPLSHHAGRLAVDVFLNGGFELACDSTTDPVKRGAYWRNAFVHEPGVSTDRIDVVGEGHALRLDPGTPAVAQNVTLYGPHASRFVVSVRVRFESDDARARLTFTTIDDRRVSYELSPVGARLGDTAVGQVDGPDADRFRRYLLLVGADFGRETGAAPDVWCGVELAASGAGTVWIDDVIGRHELPRFAPSELRHRLLADVRDILQTFVAPPNGNPLSGLGLVDPESGYLTGVQHHAETGEILTRTSVVGIAGIHELMLNYLRAGDDEPDAAPLVELVRDRLKKHVISVMKNNVYRKTKLYCLHNLKSGGPIVDAELSPSHFINYVYDVAEVFPEDETLTAYARVIGGEMADAMVKLRDEHDLPKKAPFGRGPGGNWHGRMPEKISPLGILAQPKKHTYDQAWAISQNRSWYHDFDTAVGLMRVWNSDPKDSYREAIRHVIRRFDRAWDAQRYDMENDTDDHYGKNVEASLLAFRYSGYRVPELLEFAQSITDYRLPRDRAWDDNLWVEGIRLGSFTTGDQPRAYRGPVWLHNVPAEQNPKSAGLAAYRHVLRELCRSDIQRRLLKDGSVIEASSYMWEMISACFQGDYIGPCSEDREWEGDMGDQFSGPSANAFRALGRTLEISSRGGRDLEFVSWYAMLHAHMVKKYRGQYGYRFGLPAETGRMYGIPERYLSDVSKTDPYGNACVFIHAETLARVGLKDGPTPLEITSVSREGDAASIQVVGPANRSGRIVSGPGWRLAQTGTTDWRLCHVDPNGARSDSITFDDQGRAEVRVDLPEDGELVVDLLVDDESGEPIDVASGQFSLGGR